MSAFWQALDWCAGQNLWTPTFLEFYGGKGGGPRRYMHFRFIWPLYCLSPDWLAASLAVGWLAAWLAASLAGGCLAGSLPDWLAG